MQFQIARTDLQRQLQHVASAVPRGTPPMPVLSNLLAEVRAGQLHLTGSDTEVTMQGACGLRESSTDSSITIPAKKLLDIVRALPSTVDALEARLVDRDCLQIRAGTGRYTLATLPATEYPQRPVVGVATLLTLSDGLLSSLVHAVGYAVASADQRTYLNGMLIHVEGSTITCVGTDGLRMAVARAALPRDVGPAKQVILARRGMNAMLTMLDGKDSPVDLAIGLRHLSMTKGKQCMVSGLIDGKYPDFARVLPTGMRHEVQLDRRVLLDAVKRATIMGSDVKDAVVFDFSGDILRLSASAKDKGDGSEELFVPDLRMTMRLGLNARYVTDALAALVEDTIYLRVNSPSESVVLSNGDGNDHVIMPMRL